MSKKIENNLVPKLRFPEFENSKEWEEKLVEEYFNVGSSKRVLQEDWTNQGVPFYRTRELVSLSKNEPFGSEIFISEELFSVLQKSYGIPTEGDFLVSGVGTLGICYQVQANDKFYFKDGNVLWFKLGKGLQSTYFKYCFQSDHIQNQIRRQASISTVGTYTIQNAKKTKFWYPPTYEEQQKIASCLSSLDEVITSESQKLDALKSHKKGLLQNLLPQKGETVPKFRFKEFEDSGEWVENILKKVATFVNEKTPLENLLINSYISTENLMADYAGVTLASKLPTSGNFTKYRKGDVLISNIRPYLKKAWFADEDGACSNDVIVIRANSVVSDAFLSSLLKNDVFINYIMKGAEGVKMPRGDKDSIKEYPVTYPKDKTEQQKIADTLSSIDELINAQSQKMEALKLHKKGLLQGLFPDVKTVNE